MPKQKKKLTSLERKNHILDTVSELVKKMSPIRITTKIIAKEAGIAEGLLYKYFPSKWHIFMATLMTHISEKQKIIPPIESITSFKNFKEMVVVTTNMVFTNMRENPQWTKLISYLFLERKPEAIKYLYQKGEVPINFLTAVLEHNEKKWGLTKQDFRLSALLFWHSIIHSAELFSAVQELKNNKTPVIFPYSQGKIVDHLTTKWFSSLKDGGEKP